jgi:hypothetical protein
VTAGNSADLSALEAEDKGAEQNNAQRSGRSRSQRSRRRKANSSSRERERDRTQSPPTSSKQTLSGKPQLKVAIPAELPDDNGFGDSAKERATRRRSQQHSPMARYSSSQRLNGTPTFSATRMYTSMKVTGPSDKAATATSTPSSHRSGVAREQSQRSALQREDSEPQGTTGKFKPKVLRNSWQEEGELSRDQSARSILLREDSGQGSFKPRASSANNALRTSSSGAGITTTGTSAATTAASPGRNIVSSRNTGWDVLATLGSTTLTAEEYELSAGNTHSDSDHQAEGKEVDAGGWDVREAKNSSSRDRGAHSSRNNPGLRQPAARAFARPRTANPAGGSHK